MTRGAAIQNKINVVVGIIFHPEDCTILIAKRPPGRLFAGLWEFPGGKIEAGETPLLALDRELQEETGISPRAAQHFLDVIYEYPDRQIKLKAYTVTAFTGNVHGAENQEIRWIESKALKAYSFPAASYVLIEKLQKEK